jgi:hypothetical protein
MAAATADPVVASTNPAESVTELDPELPLRTTNPVAISEDDGAAIKAAVAISAAWSDADWVAALVALRADIGRYRRVHDEVLRQSAVPSDNVAPRPTGAPLCAPARAPVADDLDVPPFLRRVPPKATETKH